MAPKQLFTACLKSSNGPFFYLSATLSVVNGVLIPRVPARAAQAQRLAPRFALELANCCRWMLLINSLPSTTITLP